MRGNISRTAFWMMMFCLLTLFYSLSTYFFPIWKIMPRGGVYALLGIDLVSLFMGVSGFKEITNWRMALRNWIIVVISAGVSVLLVIGVLIQMMFPPGKKLIETTHSPNMQYVINIYLTNGGATTSYGIIGELNGLLWFKKQVFTDYKINYANVEWKNNYTVSINGHVLNLRKGQTYSFTRDPNWEKEHN